MRRHIKCDVCGKERANGEWPTTDAERGHNRVAEHEVHVSSTILGYGWEGNGERNGFAWDFCPTCFDDKVRPLLETLAMPRKVEESW
jgi:hypothetical protein